MKELLSKPESKFLEFKRELNNSNKKKFCSQSMLLPMEAAAILFSGSMIINK